MTPETTYLHIVSQVVFVIDSADKERLPEALAELTKLIAEKELKDAALLLLANKQVRFLLPTTYFLKINIL